MAASPENPRNESTTDVKTLVSKYSNNVWRKLLSFFPSRDSNLLDKISNPQLPRNTRARSRRRKSGLPLPLPSKSLECSGIIPESSRVLDMLDSVLEHVLASLHDIQKSLRFWQSREEGSGAQKLYFMVFERGPWAFINGTVQLIHECVSGGFPVQHLCHNVVAQISERIAVLTSLQQCLAQFLAQVYMEVDNFGDNLIKDPEISLPSLLIAINSLFSKLEASIRRSHEISQGFSGSVDWNSSFPLLFDKLPEANLGGYQWTDCQIIDAVNLIHMNLQKLDCFLSLLVPKYRKPRRMTLYWFRYTCGAIGLTVCSVWLLRHSSLMGSSDIDNWIREARDSTVSFWSDHVEQPLLSIRDELFETFRRRHKGVMELEEVQLTANSLHRMLLAFSEQTKGENFPENVSDQKMMEIVMVRYEKELMHPIQSLLGGELARALLIQIQKLKLDIETAMLELNQILRANEINFAILAALPAFFLSLIFLMLLRAWVTKETGADGRGRIARLQRRLLVVEVEKRIMQFQNCVDLGLEEDAYFMFGLLLYSLDHLYKAVERHAKATGEWLSLRQDIIDLAKPDLKLAYKLTVTSRMEQVYECLLPSSKRQ
ncbi:hypothetical protein NE237_002860 [Protea cynaroides]|uniref:Protein DGS1, mitochondrial n=1 Tax=Protea cynaroides TaxID=273540 RepID=A0A9Q0KFZ3_9MAGN|nr:hypothetical protein NE237_002860 [Protea cynaroides]